MPDSIEGPHSLADVFSHVIAKARFLPERSAQHDFFNSIVRSIIQAASFSMIEILDHRLDDLAETDLPNLARQLLRPNDGDTVRLISLAVPLLSEAGIELGPGWFAPSSGGTSLRDRTVAWCEHRNNRIGHGVVAGDIREEALSWLPLLSEDLVAGLSPVMPAYSESAGASISMPAPTSVDIISVPTVRCEGGKPTVVRQIQQRGDQWCLRAQVLDAQYSPEISIEFEDSALTRLVSSSCSRYRQVCVEFDDDAQWRPTAVLLPARQTDTFEGRSEQLKDLAEWLNDSDSRACNLYGEGGIGKTTLVLELLNRLLEGDTSEILWRPEVICFFSAKLTRWGPEGLVYLKGIAPPLDDAVRSLAAVYEDPLGREWYSFTGPKLISRVETLLHDLGLHRQDVLLILDNTETLARSADDEQRLGEAIERITKRLGRVLITSRRRERMEARPIELLPLSVEEGLRLVYRLATTYKASPILQAGDPGRRKLVEALGGHPIKLDACCRLIGRYGHSLDRAKQQVLSNPDLSQFLYDDAWARIAPQQRKALVALAQMGDSLPGELIHFICGSLHVDLSAVLNALEETKFSTRFDYASQFDIRLQTSALSFLSSAFERLAMSEREEVNAAVAEAGKRRAELLRVQSPSAPDEGSRTLDSDASKAAWLAEVRGEVSDATFWYEEAIKVQPGNVLLLERFANFLSSKVRDLERASLLAEEACRLDPTFADAFFSAGSIAASRGDRRLAHHRLERAQSLGFPSHRCNLQRARALVHELENDPAGAGGRNLDRTRRQLKTALSLLDAAYVSSLGDGGDHKHHYDVAQVEKRIKGLARQYSLSVAAVRP